MRRFFLFLCLLFLLSFGCDSVLAAEQETHFLFSSTEFQTKNGLPDGILITELTGPCIFQCGSRQIRSGDFLTATQLSVLEVVPLTECPSTVTVSCLPVYGRIVGPSETFYLSLRGTKNQPPKTSDSSLETYKNLEITGKLSCEDPEDDPLIYVLTVPPRRGEVAFRPDGTFVYVPDRERVGSDRFSFVAEDSAGNRSQEATVTVTILNPVSSAVFADMTDDPDRFYAQFLADTGLFSGETIGGTLCFCPDQIVTKAEYLLMLLTLSGHSPETEAAAMPQEWFSPWRTAALRAGVSVEHDERFTTAEAAAMTGQLYAAPSFSAHSDNGILTRRKAAKLLYDAVSYANRNAVSP